MTQRTWVRLPHRLYEFEGSDTFTTKIKASISYCSVNHLPLQLESLVMVQAEMLEWHYLQNEKIQEGIEIEESPIIGITCTSDAQFRPVDCMFFDIEWDSGCLLLTNDRHIQVQPNTSTCPIMSHVLPFCCWQIQIFCQEKGSFGGGLVKPHNSETWEANF